MVHGNDSGYQKDAVLDDTHRQSQLLDGLGGSQLDDEIVNINNSKFSSKLFHNLFHQIMFVLKLALLLLKANYYILSI